MNPMYFGTIFMLDLFIFIPIYVYIISSCLFFKINEEKLVKSNDA